MSRIDVAPRGLRTYRIPVQDDGTVNGCYRLVQLPVGDGRLPVLQFTPSVALGGQAVLSVDGETGDNNVVDLSDQRVLTPDFTALYFDLDISGVPAGGLLTVYVL
ncbi:hypothetical protein [Nitratidesulfovibrio termitidis]|uniref:hypothetical protein n=1 Tax=Nitratidesulfovibrio termitidis TaxID=42252 RepID=UPI0003F583FE|nr:hypothetical protein [Nitratidesulfovibrio termitidis]